MIGEFVFGVDPYPDWFKYAPVVYIYNETKTELIGVRITNTTGDVHTAYVGDTIVRIADPIKGIMYYVIAGSPKES